MSTAIGIILLLGMLALLIAAILRESIFDKILLINSFSTYVVVLIVLFAKVKSTYSFLDVALVYACVNFITMILFLRYFQSKNISESGS